MRSVKNLWKKIKREAKDSKIEVPAPDRLAVARHRRGKRGHETAGFAS